MSQIPTPEQPQQPPAEAQQPPVPEEPPAPPPPSSDERTWAMLCHLTALCAFVGIPLGHIIGPLVVWLLKKNEMPLVDAQGKKSLNFQITMSIAAAVAFLTVFVLVGVVLLPAVIIFDLICVIIASVKTSNAQEWDYPLSIVFIK